MTFEERINLIAELAQAQTEKQSIKALMGHYFEEQCDYFDTMTDEELLQCKKTTSFTGLKGESFTTELQTG